jgi:DNA ligase-associated metallophosphoesterase
VQALTAEPADPSVATEGKDHTVVVAGAALLADPAGALYWPDEQVLVVADLHLEKGSAFARRGVLLPPYDTAATLARLARLVERYAPRVLSTADRGALNMLQRGRDWIWIAGNHDPDLPDGLSGRFADVLAFGPLTFRHEPSESAADGEIAGHLHPVARVAQRGRAVGRRCFAADGRRLVMPAFGAYAGGLNVRDDAISGLFGTLAFTAHMLGARRLFAVAAVRCLPD